MANEPGFCAAEQLLGSPRFRPHEKCEQYQTTTFQSNRLAQIGYNYGCTWTQAKSMRTRERNNNEALILYCFKFELDHLNHVFKPCQCGQCGAEMICFCMCYLLCLTFFTDICVWHFELTFVVWLFFTDLLAWLFDLLFWGRRRRMRRSGLCLKV